MGREEKGREKDNAVAIGSKPTYITRGASLYALFWQLKLDQKNRAEDFVMLYLS